jgi:hypothetical protein
MSIKQQVHEKFKVFVGSDVADVDTQLRAFTAGGRIASKSIGIEYIEPRSTLVLSLGYRPDETGYAVKLASKNLGSFDPSSSASISALEAALDAAAAASDEVICHELYVAGGAVTAVLLTLA